MEEVIVILPLLPATVTATSMTQVFVGGVGGNDGQTTSSSNDNKLFLTLLRMRMQQSNTAMVTGNSNQWRNNQPY